MLRNQGKNPDMGNKISEFGHNWRMSEFTAVLGVQQMLKADAILADRGRIAQYYNQALEEFQGLRLLAPVPNSTSSWYKYIAYLDPAYDRADVKRIMREKYKVSLPGEVYADLCHREPIWDNYTFCGKRSSNGGTVECNRWPGCGCGENPNDFPGAEHISKYHICLPMYPGISDDDLKYIVESLDKTLHDDLKS